MPPLHSPTTDGQSLLREDLVAEGLKRESSVRERYKMPQEKTCWMQAGMASDGQNWSSPAVTVTHAQGKTETQPL